MRIRVLHIVKDDKFTDDTLRIFEKDGRFDNRFVIIEDTPEYKFKLIKNSEKIQVLHNERLVNDELKNDDYDVVFFYSIPPRYYSLLKKIPDDKIVIWWSWGYDIYEYGSFIDINLYKPLTQKYINSFRTQLGLFKASLKKIPFLVNLFRIKRNRLLGRIDYFQPVIHSEFEMMKKNRGFHAKEFYYPYSRVLPIKESIIPQHGNSIIIGHSATYTNNHLDVWNAIRDFIPNSVNVFFPVNYGNSEYADFLSRSISSDTCEVKFIRTFLPLEDYYEILDSCSYAVFGVVRQAAMGNIFRCLYKGVKVFLYKDSIPYKFFKDLGFVIYTIEEVNENSFTSTLTEEQKEQNRLCLMKEYEMVHEISERAIGEIIERVSKKRNI